VHHQTVQRRVERALAYGALAALDDRRLVQHRRRNFFAVRTALASGDSTSTASAVVTTSSPRRALGGRARHRAVTVGATKAVKLHKVMRATMGPSVMNLSRPPSAEQQCQAF
jgi:hypothetical protein